MKIQIFYKIDNLIMAAYSHVNQTNEKVIEYYDREFLGFKSDNMTMACSYNTWLMDKKRSKLFNKINNHGLLITDVINKQLMVFL